MGKTLLSSEEMPLADFWLPLIILSLLFLHSKNLADDTDFLYWNMTVNNRICHQAKNQGPVLIRARVKAFWFSESSLLVV